MATEAQFRLDFPEFADTTVYTSSSVNFWITVATRLLNPNRWFDNLDLGIELFTAHNLALERLAMKGGAGGGIPGLVGGIASSKTIDKLSVTYDTKIGLGPESAGQFNLTIFGLRFWWLLNMAGMGPTQVGAGVAGFDPGTVAVVVGGVFGPGWPYV